MRDTGRRVLRRAGRRGAFLAFLAILDGAYGYSLIVAPAAERTIDLLLPWAAWGIIWLAAGAVCAARVFGRRDRIAYTCAATLKTAWALTWADAWITHHTPLGWVAVVVWLAFAATVLVIASWPEPPDPPAMPPIPDPGNGL